MRETQIFTHETSRTPTFFFKWSKTLTFVKLIGESANKAQQLPMPHSSRGQKRMMKINATTAKAKTNCWQKKEPTTTLINLQNLKMHNAIFGDAKVKKF